MNSKDISVVDGAIKIGRKEVEFPWPVAQVVEYHRLIVVRIEPPAGNIFNRNVFAFDDDGSIKWQIEESPHGGGIDKPYMNISISENGEVIASNWNGIDYIINLDDGSVKVKSFNK